MPTEGERRSYATTGWIRLADSLEQAPLLREYLLRGRTTPAFAKALERVAWRIWRESPEVLRGEFELDLKAK